MHSHYLPSLHNYPLILYPAIIVIHDILEVLTAYTRGDKYDTEQALFEFKKYNKILIVYFLPINISISGFFGKITNSISGNANPKL